MPTYQFAGFTLNTDRCELIRDGVPVDLRPKVFDVLAYLVRHRHRVVSQDELIQEVWGLRSLSPSSVPTTITTLRKALDDASRAPNVIHTLPRRGYRFAAPVEVHEPGKAAVLGRDQELLLMSQAQEAALGTSRLHAVFVSGAQGIGKTHIAREFARRGAQTGLLVLQADCCLATESPSGNPWVQICQCWLSQVPRARADPLSLVLSPLTPPSPNHQTPAPATPSASAGIFASELQRDAPVLLILDNIHRTDPASLQFLIEMCRQLTSTPLLLVATYRDGALQGDSSRATILRSLLSLPNTSVIPLAGLTLSGITEFLAHHHVPSCEALAPQVEARTEGNPLFISQLLPLLRSRPLSALPSALPEGVQAAVLTGMTDLPDATRALLAAASVIGSQFWIEGLSKLLNREPDDCLEALQPAISEGLVRWEPNRPIATFSHDLVREAIYSAIPASERTLHHHRVIELLSRPDARGPRPTSPTLARHYTAAAVASPEALGCHLDAALWAARDFDYEYAAEHLGHALDCLEIVDPDDTTRRCDILIRLGEAQVRAGDRERGHRNLLAAIQLARRTANDAHLARAALAISPGLFSIEVGVVDYAQVSLLEEGLARMSIAGNDNLRIRLLARLALAVNGPGSQGQAAALLESAQSLTVGIPEGVAAAEVLAARCAVDSGPDQYHCRLSLIEDGLAAALGNGQLETALLFRLFRITARLEAGDLRSAKMEIELFSDLGATLHLAPSNWYVILFRAMDALLKGDLSTAEEAALQLAIEGSRVKDRNAQLSFGALMGLIRTEQGRLTEVLPAVEAMKGLFPTLDYAFDASLASAFAQSGRLGEARAAFDHAISRGLTAIPRDAIFLEVASMLAVACGEIGTDHEAAELYEMLVPFEDRVVVVGYAVACLGSLARFVGILATKLGQWDRAERHFLTALRCNRSLGSPLWLAHTYRDYARMAEHRRWPGDRARARDLLQKAHAIAVSSGLLRLADVCSAATSA